MWPDEPGWWYGPQDAVLPRLLAPAGNAWGWLAERRFARATPYRSALPVICIGNFTAGGTGKTPLALLVAAELRALGKRAAFLTRGYGGRLAGPHLVAPERDRAIDVGDEPLLLAAAGPVMIARDRAAGARAIEALVPVPDVIVMDDGLQNPALEKDLTLAVVDGRRGLGNGRVMPAGPLRAPLGPQLGRVDAVVINEPTAEGIASDVSERFRARFTGPVLGATVVPTGETDWLKERPVVAYAAIGSPGRFFALLRALGATVVEERRFRDHHAFRPGEASRLIELAAERSGQLVTTAKDHVRIAGGDGALGELWRVSRPLPIEMRFEARDQGRLRALIESTLMKR